MEKILLFVVMTIWQRRVNPQLPTLVTFAKAHTSSSVYVGTEFVTIGQTERPGQ